MKGCTICMSYDTRIANDMKGEEMKTVFEDLLFANIEIRNKEEVINFLSKALQQKGKVKEGFANEVIKREESFPTGLPTFPYGVAIPHTEQGMVNETTLAFASLKEPIIFKSILGDDGDVQVRFVFLLASRDSDGHLKFMKNIMTAFQSEEIQIKLLKANSSKELFDTLSFIDRE